MAGGAGAWVGDLGCGDKGAYSGVDISKALDVNSCHEHIFMAGFGNGIRIVLSGATGAGSADESGAPARAVVFVMGRYFGYGRTWRVASILGQGRRVAVDLKGAGRPHARRAAFAL